jgi:hypothetical protein
MKRAAVLVIVTFALALAACGSGGSSGSSLPLKTGRFRLDEWSITADRPNLRAGSQTITATNTGHETHELVIVAASSVRSLPTKPNGSVEEAQLDAVKVGEIANVAAGTSRIHVFDLAPGSYVVFCNLVEQMGHGNMMGGMGGGMAHVHFDLGMHTTFNVTA